MNLSSILEWKFVFDIFNVRVYITLLEHCVLSYIIDSIEYIQNLEMVTRKTMFSEKKLYSMQ